MWRWVELKLTWKWCLTGKSDEDFCTFEAQTVVCLPTLHVGSSKTLSTHNSHSFPLFGLGADFVTDLYALWCFPSTAESVCTRSQIWWCHFSLKDVADLILENPHYWSSFDVVMRRFHSTLSWCLLPIPLLINDYVVHLISADSGWCHQPPQPQPQIQPNLCIADSSGARMYYILLRWSYTWEVWIPCDQSVLHWIVGDLWT